MKIVFVVLIAIASISAFAGTTDRTVIHHSTCKVVVNEAVNYRGMGDYTDIYGPLKGYAQSLKDSLISDLGYFESNSSEGAIIITLRTSYADFYIHKDDGFSMKKKASFCYIDAQSSEFSDIGFYQESKNCKKSLKAVVEQMPKCEINKN